MSTPDQDASSARSLLDAGIAASQGSDSERALSLFREASAVAPQWGLPHFLMGSELAALSQWDRAEAELANAVLIAPDLVLARYQLGLLQFSSGRAAAALVTWQPLAGSRQEPGLSHFVEGFAALAQDAFDVARASMERGLSQPNVNVAVAGDIKKILQAMPASAEITASPRRSERVWPTAHVLVSNYDQFKLH